MEVRVWKHKRALFGEGEPKRNPVRVVESYWEIHRMPRTRAHFDLGMEIYEEEFEELAWSHRPEAM